MTLWTTFCPQKVCWELTYRETRGNLPTSQWQQNKSIIRASLSLLKDSGIAGIRLVIFPYDLIDGDNYDFSPVEYCLEVCRQLRLQVDFCLGPFQYPHYPGIRLPYAYCQRLTKEHTILDNDSFFRKFGLEFLEIQLKKYGRDARIRGFYLGNEWPDRQKVEQKESIATSISKKFMLQAVTLCKESTDKPIFFNTNIDSSLTWRIRGTVAEFFDILGEQSRLGYDIYPSQESWKHRLLHWIFPHAQAITSLTTLLPRNHMVFTELEAQPWGGGKAWDYYLKQARDPQRNILTYSRTSLPDAWSHYVIPSKIQEIGLWGAEFWLVCYAANITWPLKQLREFTHLSS